MQLHAQPDAFACPDCGKNFSNPCGSIAKKAKTKHKTRPLQHRPRSAPAPPPRGAPARLRACVPGGSGRLNTPSGGGQATGRPAMASGARRSRVPGRRVLTAVTGRAMTAPPLTVHPNPIPNPNPNPNPNPDQVKPAHPPAA
eukprot:scaffold114672_cov51-Phaeocystis_antarctica.AAC.1